MAPRIAKHQMRSIKIIATTRARQYASMDAMFGGANNTQKQRKPKGEGDISSVFASLSGEEAQVLPQRFSDMKKEMVPTKEAQERLVKSWNDLLATLKVETARLKKEGVKSIPEVSFKDIMDASESTTWKESVKKSGVVVIRDVVDDKLALQWKEMVKDYVKKNPQVKGFPPENKQVFELYWSKAQLAARTHPNVLAAQRGLMGVAHIGPEDPVSIDVPIAYADRLRIRLPGDSKFALGPHIDGGSLERWEDLAYRGCYREILDGRWRDHQPWDIGRRLGINSDIYGGPGQCGVFRLFQGWFSMSTTGPNEGTLQTYPLLKESSAYVILRPFFQPTVPKTDPNFLEASSWKLDLESTEFPNSAMGRGQELNDDTHPHLQLSNGGMVSLPQVRPGDMVFWHCDGIHAVESVHRGVSDSSVMYIPAVPLTKENAEYLVRQRATFETGAPSPDFPGGVGEAGFIDAGSKADLKTKDAKVTLGLGHIDEWKGMTPAQKELVRESNAILGF